MTKNPPQNIKVGDMFMYKKNKAEVVDICEVKSIHYTENNIQGYICYARCIDTLAQNVFEVPTSTIQLNKIIN